jgi:hypothetical protein
MSAFCLACLVLLLSVVNTHFFKLQDAHTGRAPPLAGSPQLRGGAWGEGAGGQTNHGRSLGRTGWGARRWHGAKQKVRAPPAADAKGAGKGHVAAPTVAAQDGGQARRRVAPRHSVPVATERARARSCTAMTTSSPFGTARAAALREVAQVQVAQQRATAARAAARHDDAQARAQHAAAQQRGAAAKDGGGAEVRDDLPAWALGLAAAAAAAAAAAQLAWLAAAPQGPHHAASLQPPRRRHPPPDPTL